MADPARVQQSALEVVHDQSYPARVQQAAVEVVYDQVFSARVSQVALEAVWGDASFITDNNRVTEQIAQVTGHGDDPREQVTEQIAQASGHPPETIEEVTEQLAQVSGQGEAKTRATEQIAQVTGHGTAKDRATEQILQLNSTKVLSLFRVGTQIVQVVIRRAPTPPKLNYVYSGGLAIRR